MVFQFGPRRIARSIVHRIRHFRRRAIDARRRVLAVERITYETSRKLAQYDVRAPLTVVFTDRLTHMWDGIYARDGDGYRLELPAFVPPHTAGKAGQLGPGYLYWLMQCPSDVQEMSVTLSDGDQPQLARFSPSTNQPHVVPIPDPYFLERRGHEWARQVAASEALPWSQRSDAIVWRGASSGLGTFDPVLGRASPVRATQRLLLCLAARDIPGVDVGLATYSRGELTEDALRDYGIVKGPIAENSWTTRKFAIDVDGQTNSWANFLVRLHFGCCVLKITSKEGYRQWYYDRLRPFEHYVPVKADLSDLRKQVDWVRSNDRQAAEIAANGQAFARALTLEEGQRQAVELISRYWNATP